MESADFEAILKVLLEHEVDFVLVGALSAVLHGAPLMTFDVDILHARSDENVERLSVALEELDARYRLKPEIRPRHDHLRGPGHQLLTTRFGPLDVLGHIEEGLEYDDLAPTANRIEISGGEILVLEPSRYLEFKRSSSRPKDRAMVPVLEALVSDE